MTVLTSIPHFRICEFGGWVRIGDSSGNAGMSSVVVVVTVDGPSGVGKGTLCARLAEHYGYHF